MKRSERNWQPFVRPVRGLRPSTNWCRSFYRWSASWKENALPAWCASVAERGIEELQRFANGLQQDKAAVLLGLTHSHNNAQAEGQVTRIKLDPRE
jgi:transposase